jgi:hypothetical protein
VYINSKETERMNNDHNLEQELDPAADARVTEALNALGTVEPPERFVSQVMWRTTHQAVRNSSQRRIGRRNGEGLDMAKKALIGLVGIAAVGLLIAYVGGFPPAAGTEGTIGAARRYQAEQIKKSDVKVDNPELAAFIQTDTFDKLVHDKLAVAALAAPEVQQLLSSPGFQQLLADQNFLQALGTQGIVQALAAPGVAAALSAPGVAAELGASGLQAALSAPALQGAQAAELRAALQSQAFQAALASPGFIELLSAPGFQLFLASPAIAQAMAAPAFQAALQSSAFQAALANGQFVQGLAAQGFINELSLQASGLAASGLGASGASTLDASGAAGSER